MRASARMLTLLLLAPVYASGTESGTDLFTLSLEELSNIRVYIATGTPKRLGASPAATSIITAVTFIARNIADTDVREATRGPEGTQTEAGIANDLPQTGRSATLEATIRW